MVYDKLNQLKATLPSLEIEEPREGTIPTAWVAADDLLEACQALAAPPDPGFDFLSAVTAVDRPEWIEVIYQLYSICIPEAKLWLKVKLADKENASVPSVYPVWKGADLQEREVWDLMGVHFEGHPHLKRILLWEGFEGHPLRKDWNYDPMAPTAGTPRLDR